MRLTNEALDHHLYVIGGTGVGKSRALESWIIQLVRQGEGVSVIDPHGDLFSRLVAHLATRPETWNRIILFDPCDPKWTVSFNPLEAIQGFSSERLALFLTDVVVKLWKLDATHAPRMVWLLTNTFMALSDLGLTLLDLRRFLTEPTFRENLLPKIKHESIRTYFMAEFPKSQHTVHEWITPALNKIGGLIFDPAVRLMVAGSSTINFRQILDQKLVLLAHLPKGIIGEGTSALLAAFLVAHFQKAALSRADTNKRTQYFLYLDEFQNYTTDNIKDILSEVRKYGLSLVLAHQYLDQLPPDLRSAVLNTTGVISCFRVGYHDARHLVREIFPAPDFLKTWEPKSKSEHLGPSSLPTAEQRLVPLGWDGLTQILANLPPRHFWVKRKGPYAPVKLQTLDMPDTIPTPQTLARVLELRNRSGAQYGRLKSRIRRELDEAAQRPQTSSQSNLLIDDIPLWGS